MRGDLAEAAAQSGELVCEADGSITANQIAALKTTQLHRHEFHGDWNYTLTADHNAPRPTEPSYFYLKNP